MKEFHVLLTCTVCGETFNSDYKVMKHMNKCHPSDVKSLWNKDENNCSCGNHLHEC